MSKAVKRLLFVCLGNICRSPAAEGVMQHLVNQRGLGNQIHIDSAGTSSYHIGEPADKRMRQAAEKRGYDLTSRSRMVSRRDGDEFDLIIAMDSTNLRTLSGMLVNSHAQIKLLSEYLSNDWPTEVPDPYYGGDEGFNEVLDMLEAACPNILAELQNDD
ncbi:MAG: low molecular weight phosphotyrosine protein phosphatase [Planctomycetales bacterium]|nr:low molecular weight phosphotyrosine protein phosphatase [Planctomycetales bacterium]